MDFLLRMNIKVKLLEENIVNVLSFNRKLIMNIKQNQYFLYSIYKKDQYFETHSFILNYTNTQIYESKLLLFSNLL